MHYFVYYTDLSNKDYSSMEPIGIFDDKEKARKVAQIEQAKIDDFYKKMNVNNTEKILVNSFDEINGKWTKNIFNNN